MTTYTPATNSKSHASRLALPRAIWLVVLIALAVQTAHTVLGLWSGEAPFLFATGLPFIVSAGTAATCLARAARVREERATWLALGGGILIFSFGMPCYTLLYSDSPPSGFPSAADWFWLALTPGGAVAIVLLIRSQARRVRFDLWLDGLIGGLAMASIGATILIRVVLQGQMEAPTANLTYTVIDLVLLGFATAGWSVFGWRPTRSMLLLTLGYVAVTFSDTVYLHEVVRGQYHPASFIDSLMIAAVAALGLGAILPPGRARDARAVRSPVVAVPFGFALAAVGLAAYLALSPQVAPVITVLNVCTLLAVVARFALTARSHLAMLAVSREEAMTDELTGLGNRRRLLYDLEQVMEQASPERPALLALFDLDGFKGYNDEYGHPAGDALLARLGNRLREAVADRGTAHRMGGDEFCVLVWAGPEEREAVVEAAAEALGERGDGFAISCSYGYVSLAGEVVDAPAALRLADRRMYARKHSTRTSPGRQSTSVLLALMAERDSWLGTHMEDTTRLCEAVGRELALPPEEMGPLVEAAALHDIGKAAIPDAILNKPGPLTDEEWTFMRRHVIIGERILNNAPSLSRAAGLVRSSHERYDGTGYPDGLAGEAIPLGARIIGACDAYDAMTSDRPYRRPMSVEVALTELRAHAGSQFDPVVIDVLCRVLEGARSAVTTGG